jgi:hypothetical protein
VSAGTKANNPHNGNIHYQAPKSLAAMAKQARVYRLRPAGDREVRRLATAFGVRGQISAQTGGHYIDDGSRRVTVTESEWSVIRTQTPEPSGSSISGHLAPGCGATRPTPSAGDDCDEPSEPKWETSQPVDRKVLLFAVRNLALRAGIEAEYSALSLVAIRGRAWTVRLTPVIAGLSTVGIDSLVSGVGPNKLLEGRGFFPHIVPQGRAPLISVSAGLQRLDQGLVIGPSPRISRRLGATRKVVTVKMTLAVLPAKPARLVPAYQFGLDTGEAVTTVAVTETR